MENEIIKLPSEFKAKWLEALRSGKYTQTRGKLRRTAQQGNDPDRIPGFCCLGVLCDIIDPNAWVKSPDYEGVLGWSQACRHSMPYPHAVPEDIGRALRQPIQRFKEALNKLGMGGEYFGSVETFLSDMNDAGAINIELGKRVRWTFNDIANFIEEHL